MPLFWLIPLVPAAGALLNGLAGTRLFSRAAAAATAALAMALAFSLAVAASVGLALRPPEARSLDVTLGPWIPPLPLATTGGMGRFQIDWTFRLDPLAVVMILIVTGVGLLIHVYAAAYMKDEPRPGYARFFAYLNLFCAFMLVLVLGANFLVLFVGWEGVGLCSYLLIGFWYEKRSAADAGRKAFLTNRVGDWAFLVGMLLVFVTFGSLDFRAVAERAALMPVETGGGTLTVIGLLLVAGATGKSAQIPLHIWLPDAMEGPTPVSALIHAATMVTAGVYVVARNAVLFTQAPLAMATIATVGAVTALTAAAVALVQNDIKRVLAFSTMSQIGYMFLATGVGAFAAGIFHLLTHALFKALLFLGSGSVIHAVAGEQDMRRMGGLGRRLPITASTMVVASLAVAGIPPFAGFVSKDEILLRAFHSSRLLWSMALGTALFTAFYIARLMVLTFLGRYRGVPATATADPAAAVAAAVHGAAHPADAAAHGQAQRPGHEVSHGAAEPRQRHEPHESPWLMTVPMLLLASGAVLAGVLARPAAFGGVNWFEQFLAPSFTAMAGAAAPGPAAAAATGAGRSDAWILMLLSVAVAAAGLLSARYVYRRPGLATRTASAGAGLVTVLRRQFFVDELYRSTMVRPTLALSRAAAGFDRRVVDGAVDGVGAAVRIVAWVSRMIDRHGLDGLVTATASGAWSAGGLLRRAQTGLTQNYAVVMIAGLLAVLTLVLLFS